MENVNKKVWDLAGNYQKELSPDVEKAWTEFNKRKGVAPGGKVIKRNFLFPLGIAASLLLLVGFFFFNKTAQASMETIHTAANQIEKLNLPDGSEVWLNENTTVNHFASKGSDRAVELQGEAFFEVEKDENNPFIIKTGGAVIEVLGTAFNVKNVKNGVEVEVRNGVVSVNGNKVKAGEQIFISNLGSIEKNKGNNIGGWIKKELNFDNVPLSEIINEIEEIYKVKVAVRNLKLNDCSFTTEFQNESIENILEVLKVGFGCELKKVTNKSFVLKGGSCR